MTTRTEHPKPQMYRSGWLNLNGEWEFEFDFSVSGLERFERGEMAFTKTINVPFCPESKLSGIGFVDFIPAVWYRRGFELSENQLDGRVILHFGAVDYECMVWVNGTLVGKHSGGYASFSLDITGAAKPGQNTLVVYARDDLRGGKQPRGKQCGNFYSHACDYTRTTGIWQTVWLEFVPKTYIKLIKMTTDPVNATLYAEVTVEGDYDNAMITIDATFEQKPAGRASFAICNRTTMCSLTFDEARLWSIDEPNLYELRFTLTKNDVTDTVESYCGLRSIEWRNHRMYLNGKPVFQRLVLDQGFYRDGIYTAQSDEDFIRDISLSQELGFNGARMHQRVFEERFMYHADKMGYLLWGEHASWGLDISSPAGIKHFLPEWLEIIERDFNHPSIIGWCPFNETWDSPTAKQDNDVLRVVWLATKAYDPTRPVIDTSGNYHVVTDIYDVHDYDQKPESFADKYADLKPGQIHETFPGRQQYGNQPYFVSEYGGTWWNPKATDESWGYGARPKTEEEVCARYEGLTSTLLNSEAVCAFCYTQLYDVEQECNGLYTYDRERKFSEEIYKRIRDTNTQVAKMEK